MPYRSQAEKVIELGDRQGGDGELPLAGGKFNHGIEQFLFVEPLFQTKGSHHGGMKAVTRRCSGQIVNDFRIKATE